MKLNAKGIAGFLQPINIYLILLYLDDILNFYTIIRTEDLQ